MIAHVAEGDAEDVNRAVSAARKAFDEGPWPKMTAYVTTHFTCSMIVYGYVKCFKFRALFKFSNRTSFCRKDHESSSALLI